MKTKRTLLVTGFVSAMLLSWTLVKAADQSLTITDLSGTVRIQQGVPCGQIVDVNATIQQGLLKLNSQLVGEDTFFDLTRLDMFLEPFEVEVTCMNMGATVKFNEIGIKLVGGVIFQGEPVGGIRDQLFRFSIPKEKFLIYETVADNNPVPQPETEYKRPSEDVTGLIDLDPRHASVQLHIVLTTRMQFRAGCEGSRCLINEKDDGTTTADVVGATNPGTTPPVVTCTPNRLPGGSFKVFASDDSGTPPIKLGTFTLANNEIIQLQQTGQPGVRLVETTRTGGIRLFQVGPGEAFITATDPQGNVGIAFCK
jgi:hypothetical protein